MLKLSVVNEGLGKVMHGRLVELFVVEEELDGAEAPDDEESARGWNP